MKVGAIVGKKKSGKTTLIELLVAKLRHYGSVGCIKHAHELDLAMPVARDTDRFFTAGAEEVIGASSEKTLAIRGRKDLADLIAEMGRSGVDFVLVEGFKSSNLPKIALNDFAPDEVTNVRRRVDFSGGAKTQKELVNGLVQLMLALEEY